MAAIAALLFLALLGTAHAGYIERLTVQVFDQNFRPVDNADVYVEYQLNDVTGNVKSKTKKTNVSGEAYIQFTDYEQIDSSVDYTYTIYVSYGSQLKTALVIYFNDSTKRTYSMEVESYYLTVRLLDQKRQPVSANVTINSQTKPTDAYGRAFFQLPPGEYEMRMETGNAVKNANVNISSATQDMNFEVIIESYRLRVLAVDEFGIPIPSVLVELGGKQERTDSNGSAVFENVSEKIPQLSAIYGQYEKRVSPMLDRQEEVTLVFDREMPKISEIRDYLAQTGTTSVSFFVSDSGKFSSGIDTVEVSYEVGGVENKVQTYTVGYNSFEAKIPAQAPGTVVKYYVRVRDKDGNMATETRSYLVQQKEAVTIQKNDTSAAQKGDISQEMTIGIGAVVFAIFAYGAVYYFKNRKIEPPGGAAGGYHPPAGGMAQPPGGAGGPVAPPSIPK